MFFGAIDQMLLQTRAAYEDQLPGAELTDVLDHWLVEVAGNCKSILRRHIPELMEGLTLSYARVFTRDELEDLLAFIKTPSGAKFFQLSSAIMAEPAFAQANQAYMSDIAANMPAWRADLEARMRERIKQLGHDSRSES